MRLHTSAYKSSLIENQMFTNILLLDGKENRDFVIGLFYNDYMMKNIELQHRSFLWEWRYKRDLKEGFRDHKFYEMHLGGIFGTYVRGFLEVEYGESFEEGEVLRLPVAQGKWCVNLSDHFDQKENTVVFASKEPTPYLALIDLVGDRRWVDRLVTFLFHGFHPNEFEFFRVETPERAMTVYAPSANSAVERVQKQTRDYDSRLPYTVRKVPKAVDSYYRNTVRLEQYDRPKIIVYDVDEKGLPHHSLKTYRLSSITLIDTKDDPVCPTTELYVRARSEEEACLLVRVDYYEKNIEELVFEQVETKDAFHFLSSQIADENELDRSLHSEERGLLAVSLWDKFFEVF